MKRTGKKNIEKDSFNLDLFEMENNKGKTFHNNQECSNVISFSRVADRKKGEERSTLEKEALKSILARATKLNW